MKKPDAFEDLELRELLTLLATKGARLSEADGVLRCDAPRGVLGAELRAALASRKQEILAFLRDARQQAADERLLAWVESTRPAGPAPLSHAQQRLWVQSQLDSTSSAYNMRIALKIQGLLDVRLLEQAIAGVIERHAVLRTHIALHDERPCQVVVDEVAVPLEVVSLRAVADRERLADIMARATKAPFDLGRAPLLRVVLAELAPDEHVLLVTLHHLVGDGASLSILAAEIAELYAAPVERRAPRLPKLDLQYADFSRWQRQVLTEERLAELCDHWVERLRGAPPVMNLPTDRPRTASASPWGGEETFVLSAELSAGLRALAKTSGTTLFTTMLTGFAVLMARYCNQDDLVIGCPISQRSHPELEPLIGMFVNSLAMRIRVDGNPSFRELLERVRAVTTDAYANQELPLDRLVEALQPERSPAHHPVFQVMFIHDNAPVTLSEFGGLVFELLDHRSFDAKFDLMLSISELPEGIRGKWEYRRDLFDPETIRRATEHLRIVLEAMVIEPRQPVMHAPLLTGAERQRMLEDWGRGPSRPEPERDVLACVRAQAERRGDAVAVAWGDEAWSYARLDRRIDALAQRLRGHGVEPGQTVAVLLPRSADMVASMLATHAVGAAYVPLDPRHPIERLRFMIEDSGAVATVTTQRLAEELALPREATVLADALPEAGGITARADEGRSPDDAAYLMYTSGSTGMPKAVVVSHRGLSNYLGWAVETYGMGEATRAVVSTSVAFDATITTLLGPLVGGGTVILVPEDDELEALAELVQSDEGADLVKITPAHVDALRAMVVEARAGGVRTIVVGGEQLLGEHVEWCRNAAPRARIFNEYGPTEAVVGCCAYEVPAGEATPPIVPIGRPIANTELYVLSEALEPVPVGVPGELYIGGAGVALGYHGRPELTRERFIESPYGSGLGARLYRTGDRVTWRPDGCLCFIGRVDDQAKIRGFRVELGEVEAALARHPGVRQAVAVARETAGDRVQLVAYVVLEPSGPSVGELRESLARWLPEPMLPGAIVPVPELSLTPNGKIDRTALPDPESAGSSTETDARPSTALERELAALWAGVLGHESVGIHDSFFHLGGDSILGIQLVARAREQGIHFTPKHLVEHQTVAKLARVVTRDPVASPAIAATSEGPAPLTPIQAWFFEQGLEAEHHFNQSIMLELPTDCDARALGHALQAVVDHHDALRARFERLGHQVQATVAPREYVGLAQVDLSRCGDAERGEALARVVARAQARLELRDGPVFEPMLVWMGSREPPRLLLSAHHLIVDGVSWRILVEDVIRAYAAALADEPITLPAVPCAYESWARQLAGWTSSEALAAQRAYWIDGPEKPGQRLVFDHPWTDDATRELHTERAQRTLDASQTKALQASVAPAYNADVQDVLLAALLASIARPGAGQWLRVDLESHGREELFPGVDVSRTVGWFTSLYPVDFDLTNLGNHERLLMQVKETLRAVPHRGIGYGVMRYLSPDAELRARLAEAPAAELSFNYFGRLDAAPPAVAGFGLAREACEPQRSPLGRRRHPLEVDAAIRHGELEVTWTYSRRSFEAGTIEAIADRFVATLQQLLASCEGATTTRYTPSDFPDVDLSQEDLNQLLADFDLAN